MAVPPYNNGSHPNQGINPAYPMPNQPAVPQEGSPAGQQSKKLDYLNCSLDEIVRSVYAPLQYNQPSAGQNDQGIKPSASPMAGEAVPFTMNYPKQEVYPNTPPVIIPAPVSNAAPVPAPVAYQTQKSTPTVAPVSTPTMSVGPFSGYPFQASQNTANQTAAAPSFPSFGEQPFPKKDDSETDAVPQSKMPRPKCVSFDDKGDRNDDYIEQEDEEWTVEDEEYDEYDDTQEGSGRSMSWLIAVLAILFAVGVSYFILWKMDILDSAFLNQLKNSRFLDLGELFSIF